MTTIRIIIIFAIFFGVSVGSARAETLLDSGYRQMYNLEFDAAHRSFREWQQQCPDDAMGPVSDAAAFLFSEFERLRILDSEFFLHDENFMTRKRLSPDPAVKQAFLGQLAAGQKLADRALAGDRNDQNALLASILCIGLHADYMALIEKRNLAALSDVKNARSLAQRLLALNRNLGDAYLAIGVENYLLSLKAAPVRWFLRMAGAQTDKETGLRNLRIAANNGHYLRTYARVLLAVAALRDNDKRRARDLLKELSVEFPRNRLYAEELARLK